MALEGTVKTPFGTISKKTAVIGGVAIAGIGGIFWWRWRQNQAAAQASSTSTGAMVTDPAGNQCAQVDPDTGYCPGTAEDEQAAQQAAYGSDIGVDYDSGGIGYPGNGAGEYVDPNGNVCVAPDADGYCPQSVTGTPTTTQITTNAEWVTEVDQQFPNYTQALAMVLGGVPVSTAQKNQFLEAVGVFGPPPQGYPSPIKTTDTPGQPGTTARVSVPNVKGQRREIAGPTIRAAGLEAAFQGSVPKGKEAIVGAQNPAGGAKVNKGSTVHLTLTAK